VTLDRLTKILYTDTVIETLNQKMTATITLPETVATNDFVATLIERNDKTAIYRRTTPEGTLLSFDVFAIKASNGVEVYPTIEAAQAGWAWSPASEERARTWFDRITNGDVVVPDVDPITGEPIGADNRSLDELPDIVEATLTETVPVVDVPPVVENTVEDVDVPTVEVPEVEVPEVDPTAPTVEPTDEVPTVEVPSAPSEGGTTPAKSRGRKPADLSKLVIPEGEFDQATFARANGLPERGVVWSRLDSLVSAGTISKRFASEGKGRPKAYFTKTVSV
jgi:hypothetical protein